MPDIHNSCPFPLVDPISGIRFESGTTTESEITDWVKGQPALSIAGTEEIAEAAEVSAENLKPKETQE